MITPNKYQQKTINDAQANIDKLASIKNRSKRQDRDLDWWKKFLEIYIGTINIKMSTKRLI